MRPRIGPRAGTCLAAALLLGATGLAQPPAAPAAKFGQRVLNKGMRGKDVRVLQRHLTRLKLPTRTSAYFGRQTRKNVRRLEGRWGWRADGRVQRRQAKRIQAIVNKRRARKRSRKVAAGAQVFPVPGPHDFGGAQSRFGAGRSGHSHQGQDIFAACAERMLSAQGGTVKARGYQKSGAGHYIVVAGADGIDYVYMHLRKASWAGPGTPVSPGSQIGKVGDSGNASGCHLHFELWSSPGWYSGGAPFDPLPYLLAWDSYS